MSGSASRASYEPYARSISQVFAYRSARSRSRLATAMRSTFGDACAAGITFRLMLPVDRMPHVTARAMWTPDLTDVGSRLALTPAEQADRPKLPPMWERDRPRRRTLTIGVSGPHRWSVRWTSACGRLDRRRQLFRIEGRTRCRHRLTRLGRTAML